MLNKSVIAGIACWLAAALCSAIWWVLADAMAQPGKVVDLGRIQWLMVLTVGFASVGTWLIAHFVASQFAKRKRLHNHRDRP